MLALINITTATANLRQEVFVTHLGPHVSDNSMVYHR